MCFDHFYMTYTLYVCIKKLSLYSYNAFLLHLFHKETLLALNEKMHFMSLPYQSRIDSFGIIDSYSESRLHSFKNNWLPLKDRILLLKPGFVFCFQRDCDG